MAPEKVSARLKQALETCWLNSESFPPPLSSPPLIPYKGFEDRGRFYRKGLESTSSLFLVVKPLSTTYQGIDTRLPFS